MTVIDQIRERAPEFAALPAIIEGDRRWTHAEFNERVDRLSYAFQWMGVKKGDALTAWLPNCHEAVEAEFAALQVGAVWVSVNWRFTWGEVRDIINDCGPKYLITDRERLDHIQDATVKEALCVASGDSQDAECRPLPGELPSVLLTGEAFEDADYLLSYERWVGIGSPIRPTVTIINDDIARLRYTSGTTGKPKAAILPHRVYNASLKNLLAELHPLTSADRVLHAAPITHASGAMMYPVLSAGGANVLMQRFDAAKVLELIERERITMMFVVPTMLLLLLSSEGIDKRDLSSLKTIMYGGAPMAGEKLAMAVQKFGNALVHIFGMTEAPYPITTLKREEHVAGNLHLGSIGRPTAICELKIINESGERVAAGEIGELLVRGENVMQGYWKDEEETKRVLKNGWLATGDLARCDSEGYYWIVDRKKDVIISGGFNVYAQEVESVLASHPDVAEAAVVGIPHAEWGETVAAFIVAKPGRTIANDAIGPWMHEKLAGYKCPRIIEFVSDLPKNSSGKIQKKELLAHYAK